MNVLARLEYELAYYDSAVHRLNHNTTRTPPQSGFSRVYSKWWFSCSFEAEIIKNCQSSNKIYSNNIVNFQESTTILNAHTKKVWKLIVCPSYKSFSLTYVICLRIVKWSKSFNWLIDKTLTNTTLVGSEWTLEKWQKEILRIRQSSRAGASLSYPGHSFVVKSYPPAEMQLVYATAPVVWTEE